MKTPMSEQEYDVVIDALQTRYDALNRMVNSNMEMGMFNIMDQIRLEQMGQLNEATRMWQDKHTLGGGL